MNLSLFVIVRERLWCEMNLLNKHLKRGKNENTLRGDDQGRGRI